MKNLFKYSFLLFIALFSIGFASCSDNDVDNADDEKDAMLSAAVKQFVDNTIIVTYHSLADASIDLYEALVALKAEKTQANLEIATKAWIDSRAHWELSEAFLFGAVADFGIDPHIDTWPLDEEAFRNRIKDTESLKKMDSEDGDVWAADNLGFALLGFHGIEYILFKEGKAKNIGDITDSELIYATAVAGDLRNQCFRLEASWAGIENVDQEKQEKLEALEMSTTLSNSAISYGENMLWAGKAGSTYRTIAQAAIAIIDGCISISDEVGDTKIGNAHRGDDPNYIESPYSYNSKEDFIDNIESIANAYLGGADANKRGASISNYIKKVKPSADENVREAIQVAIEKIKAIPYPFKLNFGTPQAGDAIEACSDLSSALNEIKIILSSN